MIHLFSDQANSTNDPIEMKIETCAVMVLHTLRMRVAEIAQRVPPKVANKQRS